MTINSDYYQEFPEAWSQETQEAWAPTQMGPVVDWPYQIDPMPEPMIEGGYEVDEDIPHTPGPGPIMRLLSFGFGLSHGYRP